MQLPDEKKKASHPPPLQAPMYTPPVSLRRHRSPLGCWSSCPVCMGQLLISVRVVGKNDFIGLPRNYTRIHLLQSRDQLVVRVRFWLRSDWRLAFAFWNSGGGAGSSKTSTSRTRTALF
ncbi:unnamed protein product, partial [Ectocarpus sp. 12 AP-2014]